MAEKAAGQTNARRGDGHGNGNADHAWPGGRAAHAAHACTQHARSPVRAPAASAESATPARPTAVRPFHARTLAATASATEYELLVPVVPRTAEGGGGRSTLHATRAGEGEVDVEGWSGDLLFATLLWSTGAYSTLLGTLLFFSLS